MLSRSKHWFVFLLMAAFFAMSMAEAVAMPREMTGKSASMAGMRMADCANMKMPLPCKDPNTLCLGSVCIPAINFFLSAPSGYFERAWTRTAYEGPVSVVLCGRTIAPDLEPPISAA